MTRRGLSILGTFIVGLAAVGGAVAFARMDEFHPWKVAVFGRPDVMKPKLGMTLPSGETYPVTLYEYTDRDHFVTNGRSVTYSFPPAYYYYALMPAPDDAAMRFQVRFDLETGVAWLDAPPELREFELDAATREEVYRRKVEATLSIFAYRVAEPSKLVEAKSRGAVNVEDIDTTSKDCFGDYRWIGKQYCGYEMFEFCSRDNPLAREAQAYPFNIAAIFALPDGSGSFSTVVECNHTAELGWCSVQRPHAIARSFRVNFGGANLCDLKRPVAAAEKLLAEHLAKETAPREGWGLPYDSEE